MGLLDRFRRPNADEIAEAAAETVLKALGQTPMAGASYTNASQPMPSYASGSGGQGLSQTPGTPATPLPRPADAFGSQLGPAQPFIPAPLDPRGDSGRALPRKAQMPVAWNLDLSSDRSTPWGTLRALAEQCDVIHRCIEIRSAEVTALQRQHTVDDVAVKRIMVEQGCSHAKAQAIARDQFGSIIENLDRFWSNPYPDAGDKSMVDWLTEALWQHFTYDALAIYPRLNLGGEVIGFEIIDGATIKPLLDNRGGTPAPPAPAFQQILWGFPRGEYQASAQADAEMFTGPGQMGEFAKDQLAYFVRNRRTWSPYGYSSVEQAIPAATLYLERQVWMRTEYTEGTLPQTFMKTDSQEYDPIKINSLERVLNDQLAGQTSERHRIKLLPGGLEPIFPPMLEERYRSDYDEHLIKQIASKFGVQPTQLGIVPRTGLGGRGQMEGEQDQAETMSKRPLEAWLTEVVNNLNRRFLGAPKDVTFTLQDELTTAKQVDEAKALQISLYSGQKTLNAVQAELGQPLYDMPEADEPFIVAGSTVTFLRGLMGTDAAGETTEQVEPGEEPEPPTPEQVAEAKAFRAFVAKRRASGKWRDFRFEHFTEEQAADLNKQGEAEVAKADGFVPPKGVQAEARRALEWIKDGHAGDGFTDTGRKRAADLAAGRAVSRETIGRISNFLGRHEGDSKAEGWNPGEKGYPSPGRVAWAAWGGDPAIAWTRGILEADKDAAAEVGKAAPFAGRYQSFRVLTY